MNTDQEKREMIPPFSAKLASVGKDSLARNASGETAQASPVEAFEMGKEDFQSFVTAFKSE